MVSKSPCNSCAKVFVVTILLVGCLKPVDPQKSEYEILEFYAGQARLAKMATALGVKSAAMDFLYDPEGDNRTKNNSMDMCTSAGFVFLIRIIPESFSNAWG